MEQTWVVVGVLVVLWVVLRFRKAKVPQIDPPATPTYRKVEGFKVVAFLHPLMADGCLRDHGVQYGASFRVKDGPRLPHDEKCQCHAIPFALAPNDVFAGALRMPTPVHCEDPTISGESAQRLFAFLKASMGQEIPADLDAYLSAVQWGDYPEALRPAIKSFLTTRYAHLRALLNPGVVPPPPQPPVG